MPDGRSAPATNEEHAPRFAQRPIPVRLQKPESSFEIQSQFPGDGPRENSDRVCHQPATGPWPESRHLPALDWRASLPALARGQLLLRGGRAPRAPGRQRGETMPGQRCWKAEPAARRMLSRRSGNRGRSQQEFCACPSSSIVGTTPLKTSRITKHRVGCQVTVSCPHRIAARRRARFSRAFRAGRESPWHRCWSRRARRGAKPSCLAPFAAPDHRRANLARAG